MSHVQRYEILESLYQSGLPCKKAAERVGLTFTEAYKHLRSKGLTRPPAEKWIAADEPDEATILMRAAEIREEWTEEEARRRWVGNVGLAVVVSRKFASFRAALRNRQVA